QNSPSSLTCSRQPSALALSSRAITLKWHCRKLGKPPQFGLFAYSVLQNELQRQPERRVLSGPSVVSTTAGNLHRPKLASSQPSPGQVVKPMRRVGATLCQA